MSHLLDLLCVHAINRAHRNIHTDIADTDNVPAVKEFLERRVIKLEAEAVSAMNELLRLYERIQEQAVAARPHDELQDILQQRGIDQEP